MKNPIIVEHVKNFARCFVLVMDRKNQLLLPKMGNLKQTEAYPEFCTFFTLRRRYFFQVVMMYLLIINCCICIEDGLAFENFIIWGFQVKPRH